MLRYTIIFVCIIGQLVPSKSEEPPNYHPKCTNYCQYGYRIRRNGCSTCRCKTTPCSHNAPTLDGYNCGRSTDHKDCPKNYECVISPTDAYGFCCPVCRESRRR